MHAAVRPPKNKVELLHGRTPCSFPFLDRGVADAHFTSWAAELARWQNVADPPARAGKGALVKRIGKFILEQYRRPIRLEVRSEWAVYEWAYISFWNRALWPLRPAGFERGYDILGHTERRREIWNNQSPCCLAFGSPEEAHHRLERFLLEAARWKNVEPPRPVEIEPGIEAADIGPFHFVRREHVVLLNVDVSGLLYRALPNANVRHEAWDWGRSSRGVGPWRLDGPPSREHDDREREAQPARRPAGADTEVVPADIAGDQLPDFARGLWRGPGRGQQLLQVDIQPAKRVVE